MKNYYDILEVSKTSSSKDIKKSFRKLAIKFHPDKNPGDKSAAKKMQELNEAYAVLGNEKLKKEYDNMLSGQTRTRKPGQGSHTSAYENERRSQQYRDSQSFYEEYMFEDFNDFLNRSWNAFGDDLNDLFGINSRSEDLFSDLYLTPDEAYNGCRKMFVFEKPILCTHCFGNSIVNDFINCSVCNNHGKVLMERKLWITIPPMTPNLGRIRLRSEGTSMESEIPGDLILTIKVNQNGAEPEIKEYNENVEVIIDLNKAMNGGPLVVKSPTGPIRINLPKEIYPGKIIRVRNEGHLNEQTMKRGHLYVQLQIEYPADPTRSQKDYIERIKSKSS